MNENNEENTLFTSQQEKFINITKEDFTENAKFGYFKRFGNTGKKYEEKIRSKRKRKGMGAQEPRGLHTCKEIGKIGTTIILSKTLFAPMERIKIILQTQHEVNQSGRRYNGVQIIKYLWRNHGLNGLLRGNAANIYRNLIGLSGNLVLYSQIKYLINPNPESHTALIRNLLMIGCACLTSAITVPLTYPLDLIHTRMSGDISSYGQKNYKSIFSTIVHSLATEGNYSPYRGLLFMGLSTPIYYTTLLFLYDYLTNAKNKAIPGINGLTNKFGIGAMTGALGGLVVYPLDTVRRCIQIARPPAPTLFRGIAYAICNIYKSWGIRGFYNGIGVYIAKTIPILALQFKLYEIFSARYSHEG